VKSLSTNRGKSFPRRRRWSTTKGLFGGAIPVYNYFRDYDGQTGRYVESDPIGLSGGTNTFSYVNGSPSSLADPFGLLVWNENVDYQLDLQTGDAHSAYTGSPGTPTLPSDGAMTLVDWSVRSKCSCTGGGAKFDEFVVNFNINVHVRPEILDSAMPWTIRAEWDHVADYLAWSMSSGRKAAKAREDHYKTLRFSSLEECRSLTSGSMRNSMSSAIDQAERSTVLRWDSSGKHNYGGPNMRP